MISVKLRNWHGFPSGMDTSRSCVMRTDPWSQLPDRRRIRSPSYLQTLRPFRCKVSLHWRHRPVHGRLRSVWWRTHNQRFHCWPRDCWAGWQWHVHGHPDASLCEHQQQRASNVHWPHVGESPSLYYQAAD